MYKSIKRSEIIRTCLPSYLIGERGRQRREIETADTSHLDNERIAQRVDCILAETDKAFRLRLGYWRSGYKEVWAAKSQVELVTEGGMQYALIPIWLAKKFGYFITIETKPVEAKSSTCKQCGAEIATYVYAPPPRCQACQQQQD